MLYDLEYFTHYLPPRLRNFLRHLLITCRMKPFFDVVQIALTYECNANCQRCSISKYKQNKNELTTEEIKEIIKVLAKIRLGKLGFFGGEPFLRDDLYELIYYASQKNIKTEILTNGYFLTEENVKKLRDAGLSMAAISLDSSNKDTHDKLRNLPGCYKRAVDGIKYCINNNIKTIINIVATKENIRNGDVAKIILLGKKLGVDKVKLIPPTMVGGWLYAKKELLEESDYKEIINLRKDKIIISEVRELSGPIYRQCKCRTNSRLFISCYGDVQPCWAIPISFGNIREDPLTDIIKSMKKFNFGTKSYDCIANDSGFWNKHLKKIDSKTKFPLLIKRG